MIPIGRRYTAQMSAEAWRAVKCDHCGSIYVYKIKIDAVGMGVSPLFLRGEGAREDARKGAEKAFAKQLRDKRKEAACPDCGNYQSYMVNKMKRQMWVFTLAVFLACANLALFKVVDLTIGVAASLILFIVMMLMGESYATLLFIIMVVAGGFLGMYIGDAMKIRATPFDVQWMLLGLLLAIAALFAVWTLLTNPNDKPENRTAEKVRKSPPYTILRRAEYDQLSAAIQARTGRKPLLVPDVAKPDKAA